MALGAVVLALSEGTTWGWSDPRIVGAFVVAIGTIAVFVRRSRRHPNPVVDPALFRDRSFVIANLATFVYAAGFFAMLLGNILFLTSVWHYSIMRAGLAVTPGPLVVAIVAGPAGKLASRVGYRFVLLTGAACFAGGLVWYVAQVGATPTYVAHWLPGTLIVGLGIGLTFPVLSAAAVSSLPAHRYAVGSAVNQTARQIGGAIGIAVLVMLLGTPHDAADAVTRFHHLWLYGAITAALSGAIGSMIPKPSAIKVTDALVDEPVAGVSGVVIAVDAV
jgi:MFS family permease